MSLPHDSPLCQKVIKKIIKCIILISIIISKALKQLIYLENKAFYIFFFHFRKLALESFENKEAEIFYKTRTNRKDVKDEKKSITIKENQVLTRTKKVKRSRNATLPRPEAKS